MQHKAVVFGIILLSSLNLYSQKAELFGGYHFPSFVISEKPESSEVHASNGNGFSLGISFQDVMIQKNPVQFVFRYTASSSDWKFLTPEDKIHKKHNITLSMQSLEAEIFPINIKAMEKKLNIGLGTTFEFIQSDKYEGTIEVLDSTSTIELVHVESYGNLVQFSFGLSANFSYEIILTEGIFLAPRYAFSYGFTNISTADLPFEAQKMKHFFELGIRAYLD